MKRTAARASIRILGIDPGLRSTGFGVIDKSGSTLAYVASGCIKTDATGSLPQRIKTILDGIAEIIATYRPQQAAVEIVFVNVNPQSTLLLGQARGAAIAALVTATCRWPNTPRCRSSRPWSATARRPRSRCRPWSRACSSCPATQRRRRRRAGLRHRPRPRRAGHGRAGHPGQARARREAGVDGGDPLRLGIRREPGACGHLSADRPGVAPAGMTVHWAVTQPTRRRACCPAPASTGCRRPTLPEQRRDGRR
jgi:hypothetical protein